MHIECLLLLNLIEVLMSKAKRLQVVVNIIERRVNTSEFLGAIHPMELVSTDKTIIVYRK